MHAFAKKFIKTLIVQFENALEMKHSSQTPTERRGEWIGRAKQLRIKIEMQERNAEAFKKSVETFIARADGESARNECNMLKASCQLLMKSITKERSELNKILQNLSQQKPKVELKLNDFIRQKVEAAFKKYDINKDGLLSMEEAREFIEQRCKFEFGKDPTEEEIAETF